MWEEDQTRSGTDGWQWRETSARWHRDEREEKSLSSTFSLPLTFCVSILWPLMCRSPKQYYGVCSIIHTLPLAHFEMVKRRRLLSTPVSSPLPRKPTRPAVRCTGTNGGRSLCLLYALSEPLCSARYLKRWISGGGTLVINVRCVQEISAILPMQRDIHAYLFYFFCNFFLPFSV